MGDPVCEPPLWSCNKHESNEDSILNALSLFLILFCFETQFFNSDFACQSPMAFQFNIHSYNH